jgi:hypothetical protein
MSAGNFAHRGGESKGEVSPLFRAGASHHYRQFVLVLVVVLE